MPNQCFGAWFSFCFPRVICANPLPSPQEVLGQLLLDHGITTGSARKVSDCKTVFMSDAVCVYVGEAGNPNIANESTNKEFRCYFLNILTENGLE